jgi:hypothetical protein
MRLIKIRRINFEKKYENKEGYCLNCEGRDGNNEFSNGSFTGEE